MTVNRRRLKQVALILFLGGIALVAYNLFKKHPVESKITLRYGRAAAGLESASLEAHRLSDDSIVASRTWRYAAHPAPESERATLKMMAQRYRFVIRLEYAHATRSDERELRISKDQEVMLDVSNLAE